MSKWEGEETKNHTLWFRYSYGVIYSRYISTTLEWSPMRHALPSGCPVADDDGRSPGRDAATFVAPFRCRELGDASANA